MNETRTERKQRLEASGQWQPFLALREQLRAEGMSPAQADEEAMRQIDATPSPSPEPSPTVFPSAEAPSGMAVVDFSKQVSHQAAAQWVASNIANQSVRLEDAPSGLAWGLLRWVRLTPANEDSFWRSIWTKLFSTEKAVKDLWDGKSACPTCGQQPPQPDEGSERAMELLRQWLIDHAPEEEEVVRRKEEARWKEVLQRHARPAPSP
jgi:hypothetical protein